MPGIAVVVMNAMAIAATRASGAMRALADSAILTRDLTGKKGGTWKMKIDVVRRSSRHKPISMIIEMRARREVIR